jgi:hypothetical protein
MVLVSDDRIQNIIDTVDNVFIRHEHGERLSDRDINSVIDDSGTLKYLYNSVNGTSTLDVLAFVHRFSISQHFFVL